MLQNFIQTVRQQAPDLQLDILTTTTLSEGIETSRRVACDNYPLVMAAGGDGTVLSVINGIMGTDTIMTTLPLGVANDYATSIGICSVEEAAHAIVHGPVKRFDAGCCSYRDFEGNPQRHFFCSTAGAGLFAEMSRLDQHPASLLLKKFLGNGIWFVLTMLSLIKNRRVPATLSLNHHQYQSTIRFFEVSKVKRIGGILVTPYAEPDNGILDAWTGIDRLRRLTVLRVFRLAEKGTNIHLHHPALEYFCSQPQWNSYGYANLTSIDIEPDEPLFVHLNGDTLGYTPARFEIVPDSLRVLTSPDTGHHE